MYTELFIFARGVQINWILQTELVSKLNQFKKSNPNMKKINQKPICNLEKNQSPNLKYGSIMGIYTFNTSLNQFINLNNYNNK
jgi:hypothetical protein